MHSNSPLPAIGESLRLLPLPQEVFRAVAPIQRLYVHTRNVGAELAAIQPLGSAIFDDDEPLAFFPESGLNVDLSELVAIYASRIDKLVKPALGLEFDFQNSANALSLVALDESPEEGQLAHKIHTMGDTTLSATDLTDLRRELDPPRCLCPHCREAADRRVEFAASHPLTALLQDAMECRMPLLCRLQSPHLGMVSWMVPGRVSVRDGRIEMIDSGGHGLLQVKLEFAHSLWVLPVRMDGEAFSVIRVFDMLGNLNLEIATPDPKIEMRWREFCEHGSSTYRADPGF